jgi:hypothetical protein
MADILCMEVSNFNQKDLTQMPTNEKVQSRANSYLREHLYNCRNNTPRKADLLTVYLYKSIILVLFVLCFLFDWTSSRKEGLTVLTNELRFPTNHEFLKGEQP